MESIGVQFLVWILDRCVTAEEVNIQNMSYKMATITNTTLVMVVRN